MGRTIKCPDIVVLTENRYKVSCYDISQGYYKPDGMLYTLHKGSVGVLQHGGILDWYEFPKQKGIHHNAPYTERDITPLIPSACIVVGEGAFVGYEIPDFKPGFLHKEMEAIWRRTWGDVYRYMVKGYRPLYNTPMWMFACYAIDQAQIYLTVTPGHEQATKVLSFSYHLHEHYSQMPVMDDEPVKPIQQQLF